MSTDTTTACMNMLARILRAQELLTARYPALTLEAGQEIVKELTLAAALGSNGDPAIDKAALAALNSPSVQGILPPWSISERT